MNEFEFSKIFEELKIQLDRDSILDAVLRALLNSKLSKTLREESQ